MRTLLALGLRNCFRAAIYRLAVRMRIFELTLPIGSPYRCEPHWRFAARPSDPRAACEAGVIDEAQSLLQGRMMLFDRHVAEVGAPPRWLIDAWTGREHPGRSLHWCRIDEFEGSDIKIIWEPSRFRCMLVLAMAFRATADEAYRATMRDWLEGWVRENPFNCGPNWKCGQETGIRLMTLLTSLWIAGSGDDVRHGVERFVVEHLRRIARTHFYAIAQSNNHWVSEACALVVGATWLRQYGAPASASVAERMDSKGRKSLARAVRALIAEDGSFAQQSTNYHRLVLDTLALTEWWCRRCGVPGLPADCAARVATASDWLAVMVDPVTGGVPNIGGNDGARLLPLGGGGYGDFRPSIQLASVLFHRARAYPPGPWDGVCASLALDPEALPMRSPPGDAVDFRDGGFVVLTPPERDSWCVIRYPRARFRPAQSDAMHVDVWRPGLNVVRDAGTFSYNAPPEWIEYFTGTRGHSTCEFDARDQMPRLGRFLFGDWLDVTDAALEVGPEAGAISWTGAYRSAAGACHRRTVCSSTGMWTVRDQLMGHRDKVVLRWRLAPADWRLDGDAVRCAFASIVVTSSTPIARMELIEGWESRHYLERTPLPVLEVEIGPGVAVLETRIDLRCAV